LKRIFSLLIAMIIAIIFISDIALLIKLQKNPNTYEILGRVSAIHLFLLHEYGYYFALLKALLSAALLALWGKNLINPTETYALQHATAAYGFLWGFIGLIIISGTTGLLQHSAGLPVELFDLSLLVSIIPFFSLLLLALGVIGPPLALMILPWLHNRYLTRMNA